jgi:hypothetical protein
MYRRSPWWYNCYRDHSDLIQTSPTSPLVVNSRLRSDDHTRLTFGIWQCFLLIFRVSFYIHRPNELPGHTCQQLTLLCFTERFNDCHVYSRTGGPWAFRSHLMRHGFHRAPLYIHFSGLFDRRHWIALQQIRSQMEPVRRTNKRKSASSQNETFHSKDRQGEELPSVLGSAAYDRRVIY